MRITSHLLPVLFGLLFCHSLAGQGHFLGREGRIHFTSDAPLELIEATSEQVSGVIDPAKGSFAFAVDIRSFQGFNSPLQREHFNENYLESQRFPKATFTGRIIEAVDFLTPGTYQVRAKGQLDIHGVKQERIIRGEMIIGEDRIRIRANFTILLEDHQITIPQIVYQKIAEVIRVKMEITLSAAGG